ncbi:DUF349 domain-containing protein [Marinoscillum furvescens]|uniref:Uncharacterized protein DUF349 n=1 Tax=Marinoscillum furvescens DSM 4134 TaxID=1122208 RepID=A0A3D9KYY4_MARFU|nr:DUF349 domain-containing protein [Marinoscillum furvescens]RED92798.1 uncharacterized protein DUF349 [Marinoscillum furvescens DSM 4134]
MSAKEIPFGKIKENKIYLNPWGPHDEREIGEVREDEATSIKYFEDKYIELEAKVTKVEDDIESSQNKGSFLMKLLHLKELLTRHDGLGDYPALLERLEKQEVLLQDIIEKNREKNTEIKTALLDEVKAAAEKINWKEATAEIHDIKERWIKTGNAKEEDQERLEEEFWGVIDAFFEKKKRFYEDKKRLGDKRVREYEQLVNRAQNLANLRGKERFDEVKALKAEWKEIGNVPKTQYVPLLKAFNYALKPKVSPRPRPQGRPQQPSIDFAEVNQVLNEFLSGERPYNFKELDALRNKLKAYRPHEPQLKQLRKEAFATIQLLMERDFVDKLANKRFSNFGEMDKVKKTQIRIGVLEELISRDQADLEKYQENSANFAPSSGNMLSMVEKKLMQQQNKIAVKTRLLEMLKADK